MCASNRRAMPEPSKYRPIYHFADERLFKAFIEKVPRSDLVDPLRGDEALRNRHFPGFRISETKPTQQQLLTAYRLEILQRGNSKLANLLCEQWIRNSHELACVALQSVGLPSEHAAEVGTWIKKIQANLEEKGFDFLRAIVSALSSRFSPEDILIFVSIIGYGRDQESVRDFVEWELRPPAGPLGDTHVERELLEQQLQSARAKLTDLERSCEELRGDLAREVKAAQRELDSAVREHDKTESEVSETLTKVEALSKQIEEIRKLRIAEEHTLQAQSCRKDELLKTVAHHREQIAAMTTGQEI